MKINFTKKEYRVLIDLLEMADWLLSAHDVKDDKRKEKYKEVIQKIYAYAKEFGFDDLIDYSETLKGFYGTRKLDDADYNQYINEYDDNNFWETLIDRLAERDLATELELEGIKGISFEEHLKRIEKYEEKWAVEFETNGLKRIEIK